MNGQQSGECGRGKLQLTKSCKFRLIENRSLKMNQRSRRCLRLEGRTTLSQMHLETHHQLFPQGINRRVRDLRKALFEVVV
ncbi:MAG: Uncharacterised protein [Prochlorococcus marinus str. MIT 9313]|nr:MAG: Uncharacterised protein [Prochlorococcus marinus str. MIT 9313]